MDQGKTFKLDRGLYSGAPNNPATIDIAFCVNEFGIGGVQPERRWFYRLVDSNTSWRRVGRRSATLRLMLYFRNEEDITFFLLKRA